MASVSHTQSMIAVLHYAMHSIPLVWTPSFFQMGEHIMISMSCLILLSSWRSSQMLFKNLVSKSVMMVNSKFMSYPGPPLNYIGMCLCDYFAIITSHHVVIILHTLSFPLCYVCQHVSMQLKTYANNNGWAFCGIWTVMPISRNSEKNRLIPLTAPIAINWISFPIAAVMLV